MTRVIDDVRFEINEAMNSLHKAMRVAVRSSLSGDDMRVLQKADKDFRALADRCAWLYERFREAELELENLYAEIDLGMFKEEGEQLDPFAD